MEPWSCSVCGRRVPAHLEICRCGAGRPAETRSEGTDGPWKLSPRVTPAGPMPWAVKLWLAFMVLALVGGAANLLLRRSEPPPIVPVLGYVDHPPPQPSPSLRPPPAPRSR